MGEGKAVIELYETGESMTDFNAKAKLKISKAVIN
jgi:hypothetical protein